MISFQWRDPYIRMYQSKRSICLTLTREYDYLRLLAKIQDSQLKILSDITKGKRIQDTIWRDDLIEFHCAHY